MAKKKLKFNAKEFLLMHVEKIILAGIAGVFLLLFYNAFQHEAFSKTPEELTNKSRTAKTNVENPDNIDTYLTAFTEEGGSEEPNPFAPGNYQVRVNQGSQVTLARSLAKPFKTYITGETRKREHPELVALAPIRVTTKVGAMVIVDPDAASRDPRLAPPVVAPVPQPRPTQRPDRTRETPTERRKRIREERMKARGGNPLDYPTDSGEGAYVDYEEGGYGAPLTGAEAYYEGGRAPGSFTLSSGEKNVGRRFNIVTSAFPIGEQWEAYQKALFQLEETEQPRIEDIVIQRADVTNLKEGEQPNWTDVNVDEYIKEVGTWSSTPPVVSDENKHPLLTSPCPKLLGHAWGDEVAYAPEIMTLAGAEAAAFAKQQELDKVQDAAAVDGVKPKKGFGAATASPTSRTGSYPSYPGGGFGASGYGPEGGYNPVTPNYEESSPDYTEYQPGYGEYGSSRVTVKYDGPSHLLIRYFDLNVEPEHTYQYRIQLSLNNPNFAYRGKDVNEEVKTKYQGKNEFLKTAWVSSEASESVPDATQLFAVEAGKKSTSITTQQDVSIMVVTWDPDDGLTKSEEFTMLPGQTANFRDVDTTVKMPGGNLQADTADFFTNYALIDMIGGDKLPSAPGITDLSPGVLVFMDEDGNVSVKEQVADSNSVYDQRALKGPAPQEGAEFLPTTGYELEGGDVLDGRR